MRNRIIEVFIVMVFIISALFMPITAYAVEETEATEPPAVTAETTDEEDEVIEVIEVNSDKTGYMDYTGGLDEDSPGGFATMLDLLNMLGAAGAEPDEPAIPKDPMPFTPGGQATVTDRATDNDGKEFYTFTTPDGNVFYLIIDHERANDNVYFLNTVTEPDLIALAEQAGKPISENAVPATVVPGIPDGKPIEDGPVDGSDKETPPKENGGVNNGMIIFIVIAVLAVGGTGYYIKIVRPKQQAAAIDDDDEDEPEGGDDDIPFEDESDESDIGGDVDCINPDDVDSGESDNEGEFDSEE